MYLLTLASLYHKFAQRLQKIENHETLLKKRLSPDILRENPIFYALIERGIIPIIASRVVNDFNEMEDTALLGKGFFSKAYEVYYKGRLAVAKITRSEQDYHSMLKLNKIKSALGSDAKYLPQIYDHFIASDSTYVIVVEKLNHINPNLLTTIYPTKFQPHQRSWQKTKDNVNENYLIDEIVSELNISAPMGMDKSIKAEVLEYIIEDFRSAWRSSSNINDFNNKLKSKITFTKGTLHLPGTPDEEFLTETFMNNAIISIEFLITEALQDMFPRNFPTNIPPSEERIKHQYYKEQPETADFIRFLYRLHDEFGISWEDLHPNNIMQRQSTGDLVVSDPGLFEFKS
jgi:hypothetical protein